MKHWLRFSLIVSCVGCGSSDRGSQVQELPVWERDPVATQLRADFESGNIIEKSQSRHLRLGQEWSCTEVYAGKAIDGTPLFRLDDAVRIFHDENGVIQYRAPDGRRVLTLTFTPKGLAGIKVFDDLPHWHGLLMYRLTAGGDLIGEMSVKPVEDQKTQETQASLDRLYMPAVIDSGRRAFAYVLCPNVGRSEAFDIPTIVGACKAGYDVERFSTEEGGCLDLRSGLVWSARAPDDLPYDTLALAEVKGKGTLGKGAFDYCKDLQESGFNDWRLAVSEELLDVAGVADTNFNFDLNPKGPPRADEVGAYFWSYYIGTMGSVWTVRFGDGGRLFQSRKKAKAAAVCVRQPLDQDGDKVPDSSDSCPATPKGVTVAVLGNAKGCPVPAKRPHAEKLDLDKNSSDKEP